MKLVSKSSVARISAFGDLIINAPELVLSSAKQLYLPDGIQYFDSEPKTPAPTTASSFNLDPTIMTQSAVRGAADPMATTSSSHHLRAYNLVAINGLLMATV